MPEIAIVVITGETAKLPPGYADFVDPLKPLPAGVAFFEKRASLQDMLWILFLAAGLGAFGALDVLITGAGFLHIGLPKILSDIAGLPCFSFLVGLTFLFASVWMFWSLGTRWKAMRRQQNGEQTRLGIFLTAEIIFEANEFGYCIVPREHFRGLDGNDVKYMLNTQEKSYRLPRDIVRNDVSVLKSAIEKWAKGEG